MSVLIFYFCDKKNSCEYKQKCLSLAVLLTRGSTVLTQEEMFYLQYIK